MEVQACLTPRAVDGSLLAALLAHDLGFRPRSITRDADRRPRRLTGAVLDELRRASEIRWAAVDAEDGGGTLDLAGIAGRSVAQVIWQAERLPEELGLLETVTRLPGFNGAWLSDPDDVHWQSETSIEAFEQAGRDHSQLPKRAGGFFPGQDEEIDTSRNAGRAAPLDGIWLHAASTMWWGPGAFRILDRERLLAVPDGQVLERDDGVVRVELFPFEWYTVDRPAMRERQQRFRDWMGFDELELRADELEGAAMDPDLEIDTGSFEHGGVRRITEWLDAAGARPVPRSRAALRRVTELGERAEVLWREELDA